ncbi:MAG: LEPR-XLL domain-containing protein, partial [Deltaproteobacteria bacterium]|nr:LEPR-XLL domain-containing protein [Deltaproteobacteria bacterium]
MYSRSLHFHQLSLEQLEPRLLLSGSADEISLGVRVTKNITSGD